MGDAKTTEAQWIAVAGAAPGATAHGAGAGIEALSADAARAAGRFWTLLRGRIMAIPAVAHFMKTGGSFVATEAPADDVWLLPGALARAGVPLATSRADTSANAGLAWFARDGGAETFAWLAARGAGAGEFEAAGFCTQSVAMSIADPGRMRAVLASDDCTAINIAIDSGAPASTVAKLYAVERPSAVQQAIGWAVKDMTCRAYAASEAGATTDLRRFNDFIGKIQVMLGRQGYDKLVRGGRKSDYKCGLVNGQPGIELVRKLDFATIEKELWRFSSFRVVFKTKESTNKMPEQTFLDCWQTVFAVAAEIWGEDVVGTSCAENASGWVAEYSQMDRNWRTYTGGFQQVFRDIPLFALEKLVEEMSAKFTGDPSVEKIAAWDVNLSQAAIRAKYPAETAQYFTKVTQLQKMVSLNDGGGIDSMTGSELLLRASGFDHAQAGYLAEMVTAGSKSKKKPKKQGAHGCFVCGDEGHMARDCRDNSLGRGNAWQGAGRQQGLCDICQKTGHDGLPSLKVGCSHWKFCSH